MILSTLGMLNTNKSRIRVMFDCSSQNSGTSINESLLSGPDLTDQLFRVFTGFREGPVGLMTLVQALFYQVKVPEKQRSFLRYLLWNEGNLDSEIVDHKISVDLFGAVSFS